MKKELSRAEQIERSINTIFRSKIWTKFVRAVKEFKLIEPNDKIAVCISGGKDSMLLAALMKQLQKYSDFPFELVYLSMNPGYNAENLELIKQNAKTLEIPLEVFETSIFDIAYNTEKSPCYLCARMRRGHLYNRAKELGCNKIALGHHKSDVIETTLMGMLYSGQIQGMLPKLKSQNFEGMELIRPLFYVDEEDIIKWRDHNDLKFLACACKLTEGTKTGEMFSARANVKKLISNLKKEIPEVDEHILKSISNCQVDTMVEYKQNGERHSFLENLDSLMGKNDEEK